jgi:hypothetical protein
MKTILALIVGIIIGATAVWFYDGNKIRIERYTPNGNALAPTGNVEKLAPTGNSQSPAQPSGDTKSSADATQEELRSLKLRTEDIKDELARTGQVIRQKAHETGQAVSDAAADSRATAAIKGKLVADPDLSALSISVNTTDGVVTLSGTVDSEDRIGKAMLLALETDNVQQVVSTLQVKPK